MGTPFQTNLHNFSLETTNSYMTVYNGFYNWANFTCSGQCYDYTTSTSFVSSTTYNTTSIEYYNYENDKDTIPYTLYGSMAEDVACLVDIFGVSFCDTYPFFLADYATGNYTNKYQTGGVIGFGPAGNSTAPPPFIDRLY